MFVFSRSVVVVVVVAVTIVFAFLFIAVYTHDCPRHGLPRGIVRLLWHRNGAMLGLATATFLVPFDTSFSLL